MELKTGSHYSNGSFGTNWSVRRVLEMRGDRLIYRTMVGGKRRERHACSLREFSSWARYEVTPTDNGWLRVD
jgi:hypothetical protein